MQRERLNSVMAALDFRQRVAKAGIKTMFVFFVLCAVFAFWASLVSCSLMQHIRHLDDLGDDSGDPVWPARGCAKESEIPKLTEPEPFDPTKGEVKSEPLPFDPSGYTGTINLESR